MTLNRVRGPLHFLPLVFALGCSGAAPAKVDTAKISSEVEQTLRDAYDLSKPGLTERMLALYPRTGRVVSATSGAAMLSRDSLEAGIRYFWDNVGVNMRNPRWEWTNFWVDVQSPTSAVVTATYRVPHLNPRNEPHVIAGAMTMLMEKQDGRWVIRQEHLSDLPPVQHDTTSSMQPHDH